jgi:flagellar hook-associated protein 3
MRVTNNMVTSQVVFNIQRSLRRFMTLQTEMSSGKRINRPSDDPVGTLRDLDYRTELSKIGQFQDNVSQGQNWLNSYDSILDDVKLLLSDAKDVALAMSNDTYDTAQRQSAANEIEAAFDRLVQLSDSQIGGRRMFSGFRTKLNPFRVGAHGVTYLGDDGRIELEIESQVRQATNLTGAEVFLKPTSILGQNADLNVAVTNDTLLVDLNNGGGIDLTAGSFTITDNNLIGVSATVDLAAAPPVATVGEALARINAALTAAGMDSTVSVSLTDDGNSLRINTTPSGQISSATELHRLYSGNGIDLSHGSIRLFNGSGIDINVDLSTATTIGELATLFNDQLASAGLNTVTMGVNAAGTGLVITDTGAPPSGLTIENASDLDLTASQLGIAGYVGAQLVGTNLNPAAFFTIAENGGTTAADLGLEGKYTHTQVGADLDPRLTLTTRLADLRNGFGFDGDRMVLWQGEFTHTVDLSDPTMLTVQDLLDDLNNSALDITASINNSGRGVQIVNNDPNRSFTIQEVDGGLLAKQMDLYGSSDMLGSLLVLANALRENDQEGINRLIQNFDDAMTHTLDVRSAVGIAGRRLESTASRLQDLQLGFTKLLSEEEDADLTKVVTDLAAHENAYQAALMSAAKIIQPSLLDFLR